MIGFVIFFILIAIAISVPILNKSKKFLFIDYIVSFFLLFAGIFIELSFGFDSLEPVITIFVFLFISLIITTFKQNTYRAHEAGLDNFNGQDLDISEQTLPNGNKYEKYVVKNHGEGVYAESWAVMQKSNGLKTAQVKIINDGQFLNSVNLYVICYQNSKRINCKSKYCHTVNSEAQSVMIKDIILPSETDEVVVYVGDITVNGITKKGKKTEFLDNCVKSNIGAKGWLGILTALFPSFIFALFMLYFWDEYRWSFSSSVSYHKAFFQQTVLIPFALYLISSAVTIFIAFTKPLSKNEVAGFNVYSTPYNKKQRLKYGAIFFVVGLVLAFLLFVLFYNLG